jgi:hypothetical protein
LVSAHLAVENRSLHRVTTVKIALQATCGGRVTWSRDDFHHSMMTAGHADFLDNGPKGEPRMRIEQMFDTVGWVSGTLVEQAAGGLGGVGALTGPARPLTLARDRLLDVPEVLAPLFPDGGLRRGSTVAIQTGPASGATTLALAVAVTASQTGSWCAVVGLPALGLVMAAGLGICLERLALVPDPGSRWPVVAAALIDAVDVVVIRPPERCRPGDARRLAARARERGSVLIPLGSSWPEADLRLSVLDGVWEGLGLGHGHLGGRVALVSAEGRGAAARPRRVQLWLPGPTGPIASFEGEATLDAPRSAPVAVAG